ncbi:class II glutamine amidotransferase [Ferviditalea candida]|uniref:Class II glutamine amidotransferase n=1 Tax=Ferviditalea candida TaxID=3108399 RepID=A0ABU5ZMD6_9BACL|nr:class II glutamine amidotransferase [Paenibacillaceae bacterium T2]
MCRLIAFASREPVNFHDLIGDSFQDFVELSERHRDGWGFAWLNEANELQVVKAPEEARRSGSFRFQAENVRARTMITHLRWAYGEGMNVCEENTHPFLKNGAAFEHNGTMNDSRRLLQIVPQHLRDLDGNTDSEVMFRVILSFYEQTGSMEEAIEKTLLEIKNGYTFTGLNFLMLTKEKLYAGCAFHPGTPLLKEEPDLYDLHYSIQDRHIIIASSQWPKAGEWPMLANGEILSIDCKSLETATWKINGWNF